MSIRSSPLLGYNNNVRHKGKVFHIQTEDSGVRYGHITTHLFMDGGRILKSVKTSYAEFIGNERMAEVVREMMKTQHKAMFIALREGKFDAASDPPAARQALRPGPATSDNPSPKPGEAKPFDSVPPPTFVPRLERTPVPSRPASDAAPDPGASASTPDGGADVVAPDVAADESTLEVALPASDLPPPPDSLLRDRTSSAPPPPRSTPPADGPGGERRYAPTRPASIFGQARPQQGKSIFGEDVLGDKSLDEVILNYLAEDIEAEKKKK